MAYRTIPVNDILDLRTGGQVTYHFRWDLLNPALETIGEIHPLLGASIDHNVTSQIMRTVRGLVLTQDESQDIDIFNDRVRPSMVLSDGTVWPLGVYFFTTDDHPVGTAQTPLSSTLMGQSFALNTALTGSFSVGPGVFVTDAMRVLAEALGIAPARYSIGESSAVISGGSANWAPDATALAILKSLADRAGFHTPYFDNSGTLILRPVDTLDADGAHQYKLTTESRILRDTLNTSTNLLTAPNVYKVIASGATELTAFATARIDASLPHSVENRGFAVVDVHRVQGVSTNAQCQVIANTRAKQDARQFATAEFASVIDPRHDTYDVVSLGGDLYREVGWSMTLAPGGQHRHTLVKEAI